MTGMRLKGSLSGLTLLPIYSQVQLVVVVFRLDVALGGKRVKTSVAQCKNKLKLFNVLCEARRDHVTPIGGLYKNTVNMNETWCEGILLSEVREQEGILSHLIYLRVHIDVYHPAGAILDPVEGESAGGELEAEFVCVDVFFQVIPLLGGALPDPEGGEGAVGGLGAGAVCIVVPPGNVVLDPGEEGGE